MSDDAEIAERLRQVPGEEPGSVSVEISYSIIKLLSEQLYASPVKAVEELVVNAWDAEANQCSIYVPAALTSASPGTRQDTICIFDDGSGMGDAELGDLWHVGLSRKRQPNYRSRRQQIGKFGIGKLASYAVARQATYFTRGPDGLRSVSIDFDQFSEHRGDPSADADVRELRLDVMKPDPDAAANDHLLRQVLGLVGQRPEDLFNGNVKTWTLVILERLRDEGAKRLTAGRLNWVLSTAMPIAADFELTLNGEPVESSARRQAQWAIDARVGDLLKGRLDRLAGETGEQWWVDGGALYSARFPAGISGQVRVARDSLFKEGAKSRDLGRSHGFFVRVRGRLVNEEDPLFGVEPRSYKVFNRLLAEIEADDLDEVLTAPRESIERSDSRSAFIQVLKQLFAEARVRYEGWEEEQKRRLRARPETTREASFGVLFERTLADAATATSSEGQPPRMVVASPPPPALDLESPDAPTGARPAENAAVTPTTPGLDPPSQITYRYQPLGELRPLVQADATTGTFLVNEDHPVTRQFGDDQGTRALLELVVTAEAVLEAQLRSAGTPAEVVVQVLARRDALLRALAEQSSYGPVGLARAVSITADDPHELRGSLVSALRGLGFAADDEVGLVMADVIEAGSVARLAAAVATDSESGETALHALAEATSATSRMLVVSDVGLVAAAEIAARGAAAQVSCWPASALAEFVRASGTRHLSPSDLLRIAQTRFAPADVRAAVSAYVRGVALEASDRARVIAAITAAAEAADTSLVPTAPVLAALTDVDHDDVDATLLLEAGIESLADRVRLSADKATLVVQLPIEP